MNHDLFGGNLVVERQPQSLHVNNSLSLNWVTKTRTAHFANSEPFRPIAATATACLAEYLIWEHAGVNFRLQVARQLQ